MDLFSLFNRCVRTCRQPAGDTVHQKFRMIINAHILLMKRGIERGRERGGGGAWSCYHWTKLNRDRLAANEAVWRSVSGKTSL